ncbi:tumor necrosis factor receptor superfamily member 1B isoform X2 [Myripristis murdjan]|uniref:tumor necrosis factor receptor superfamily member 1B isoform X2 n=1 Tax=Myripristis murdjan TaxID=586833 RepID=UPI001175EC20|nr:tumor necrosis factor receptor superfamily member 1B-like isoform X2 [Myripristis murdjan]
MKDAIALLLILLNVQIAKMHPLPYQADSNRQCQDPKTEYLLDDGSNLCCKKCAPGHRLVEQCSDTTNSVCEPCPSDQYLVDWNFSPNCFSCPRCKAKKGLQYAQNCSSSTKSKCVCLPGMYCMLDYNAPYCSECAKYTTCKPGTGVSIQGTPNSNVKCAQCKEGTFSNKASSTNACQPHTNCQGRAVLRKGNATSDTVCEPEPLSSTILPQSPPAEPRGNFVTSNGSPLTTAASPTSDPRLPVTSSFSGVMIYHSTKAPLPDTNMKTVAAIASAIGLILLFIIVSILLFRCNARKRRGAEDFHPKTDANGNCERDVKQISQNYSADTHLTSFTVTSPEQQCLLEKGETCSPICQSSDDTEISTKMEGCSNQGCESISTSLYTTAPHDPHSMLSEPMSLLSNSEPISSQPSIPPQSSSQPTSPQLISPVAASPHVNVNITFHIGNGSCGTPPVIPTNSVQTDSDLPVGEEEECFSVPQQEAGKQLLTSVAESLGLSDV